ncbi:MAG: hypothetical protein HWE39_04970 [Oceanospirillaceae bacterium]|nr:hypothetical protein [Oceanospirillaceae bacterium]
MHDPVMMDRGVLADRTTTRHSFIHAGWIISLAILALTSLDVNAGSNVLAGDDLNQALGRILGEWPLLFSCPSMISGRAGYDFTLPNRRLSVGSTRESRAYVRL